MDIGAAGATVALAKAVVVHAVLLGLLLLLGLPDDGEAPLDGAAGAEKHSRSQQRHSTGQVNTFCENSSDSCRSTCAAVICRDGVVTVMKGELKWRRGSDAASLAGFDFTKCTWMRALGGEIEAVRQGDGARI